MNKSLFLFFLLCAMEAVGLHHSSRKPFEGRLSLKKIKESMANKLAHLEELTGSTVSSVSVTNTTKRPRKLLDNADEIAGERNSDDSSWSFWGYFERLFSS